MVVGNRLYGLGAMDMKGGLAAAMHAVVDLARQREDWNGTVLFAAMADEEGYSRGAKAFLRTGRKIDAAIMCEPNFNDPAAGAIGKFNLRVAVTGRSTHGSTPQKGANAVVAASRLIAAIDGLDRFRHPRFGRATHCVLSISSGDRKYEIRVPDHCSFVVNWHVMPGESSQDALSAIGRLIEEIASPAEFVVELDEPRYESYVLDDDEPLLRAFSDSYRRVRGKVPTFSFANAVSDANLFNVNGRIPTLLFGPSGQNLHSADEWVELDQVEAARAIYRDIGLNFFRAIAKGKHHVG
jgi:acetylornithine deacetylase/succinyl-diaminopimelate desuccinylase-like protein